jgi:6-phosphogluconolactonase
MLSPVGWESTAGKVPRFMTLSPSGTQLFAANQNSDTIVGWDVDERNGRLTRTKEVVPAGTPTAIAFAGN